MKHIAFILTGSLLFIAALGQANTILKPTSTINRHEEPPIITASSFLKATTFLNKQADKKISHSFISFEPNNLHQEDIHSAWCEGVPGAGIGEDARIEYSQPHWIKVLKIRNGFTAKDDPDTFTEYNRIKAVKVSFNNKVKTVMTFTLKDNNESQTLQLPNPIYASEIQLTIASAYLGQDAQQNKTNYTCLTSFYDYPNDAPTNKKKTTMNGWRAHY